MRWRFARSRIHCVDMDTWASEPSAPPRRLNLREFARHAGGLRGSLALAGLPRLAASLCADARQLETLRVRWSLHGSLRTDAAGVEQARVSLHVEAELPMLCQRCLQAALQPVRDSVTLLLVDDEPELEAEEIESEEEAFCARHPVDVAELIEDQLILALPLVPMHPSCPQPLAAAGAPADASAPVSPFAVLAGLRKAN